MPKEGAIVGVRHGRRVLRPVRFGKPFASSQVADLEEPEPDEGAITIELGRTPEEMVEEIKRKLRLASKD